MTVPLRSVSSFWITAAWNPWRPRVPWGAVVGLSREKCEHPVIQHQVTVLSLCPFSCSPCLSAAGLAGLYLVLGFCSIPFNTIKIMTRNHPLVTCWVPKCAFSEGMKLPLLWFQDLFGKKFSVYSNFALQEDRQWSKCNVQSLRTAPCKQCWPNEIRLTSPFDQCLMWWWSRSKELQCKFYSTIFLEICETNNMGAQCQRLKIFRCPAFIMVLVVQSLRWSSARR